MTIIICVPDHHLTELQLQVVNGMRQNFISEVDEYVDRCIKFNRSRSHEVSPKVQKNKKKI